MGVVVGEWRWMKGLGCELEVWWLCVHLVQVWRVRAVVLVGDADI